MQEVTKRQLELFYLNSAQWLEQNPIDSKFSYAIKKMKRRVFNLYEDYMEEVEGKRLDYAQKDEKGIVIKNDKGEFQFSAEDNKKLIKELKELSREKVQIAPFFVDKQEIPELHYSLKEVFTNFVIKEEEESEEPQS